jgi:hypothetical protein
VKELGDGAVKELVGAPPRLQDVVVHAASGHRAQHGVGGTSIAPCAEADEQGSLGVGKQRLGACQELLAGQLRHPLVRQHERDGLSGRAPALEVGKRRQRRALAGNPIVAAVPPLEFAPNPRTGLAIVLDDEHDGRHRSGSGHGLSVRQPGRLPAAHSSSSPPPGVRPV